MTQSKDGQLVTFDYDMTGPLLEVTRIPETRSGGRSLRQVLALDPHDALARELGGDRPGRRPADEVRGPDGLDPCPGPARRRPAPSRRGFVRSVRGGTPPAAEGRDGGGPPAVPALGR